MVERNLAKVEVASSTLVSRSIFSGLLREVPWDLDRLSSGFSACPGNCFARLPATVHSSPTVCVNQESGRLFSPVTLL